MSFFPCHHTCSHLLYAVPIGPFDGCCRHTRICLYNTKPRSYFPSSHAEAGYFLRSDFRYGPDDYTPRPQASLFEYPHCADFFPLENGILDGMGQLSTSKYWIFQEASKDLKERVEKYRNSTPNPLLSLLVRLMDNTLIRMGSLKSPFGLMWFKITEFQHLYLEVYALLNYLEIYTPCIDRQQPAATSVANCIRAFTNKPNIAQSFH